MKPTTPEEYADSFLNHLTSRLQSEVVLHTAIAELWPHLRPEHRFSATARIDFFDEENRIGIECKTQPGAAAIERQLARYEQHCPGGLVLVTTRAVYIRPFLQVPFATATLGFW